MVRRTQDFHLLWLLLSLQFPSHPRHAVAVVTYNSLLLERFSCWTPIQGVFTRCYSHHHGYFLFLHLIICLNSVGDRDGEMGCEWMWMWMWMWINQRRRRARIKNQESIHVDDESPFSLPLPLSIFLFLSSDDPFSRVQLSSPSFPLSPSLPHTLQAFTFDRVGSNNTSLHSNTTTDVSR